MGSIRSWPEADGRLLEHALYEAVANPIEYELPASAFRTHSTEIIETDQGVVTVPRDDEDTEDVAVDTAPPASTHTEIQALLARDRPRHRIPGLYRLKDTGAKCGIVSPSGTCLALLPISLSRSQRVGSVSSVTSTSCGSTRTRSERHGRLSGPLRSSLALSRMTDLLALQPNLSMPMFLSAPNRGERR